MSEPAPTWFERQFLCLRAHRTRVFLLLALLMAAAIASIGHLPFANSVDVMLPDGEARDTIRFLTEASLADKVVVSLEKTDPALPQEDFVRAADQLAAKLRSPMLAPLDTNAAATGMLENFTQLLGCAPQLFDAPALAAAQAAVTPEAIDQSVRALYQDLAKPSSLFTGKLARLDPLGITRSILGRLERLSAANLYDVTLENGHLFSRDHRHLLLVFTTPVSLTDSEGSRALVAHLDAQRASLPAALRADVVCGHLHTASNEHILKRDIERTSWIGAIAFLVIFAGVFRDWRCLAMLAVPVCTAFLALPLAALCHSQLSYIVLGFGMVIVGISSDYGIYVYVMTRHSGEPALAVSRIIRPMGLGMATTLAVFVAFYFSGIEGYRQLATFAIFSIALAYLAALFLLPHFLGDKHAAAAAPEPAVIPPVAVTHPRTRALTAGLALVLGIAMISRGVFNTDITQLDGTDRRVLEAETRFEKTWSSAGTEQGILAVTGPTYEEALRRSETIYDQATGNLGSHLLSFSALWRSEASRAANLARWHTFWTPERIADVQARLLESGQRYGFTATAFAPFLDQLRKSSTLREPTDNALFKLIKDRFVRPSASGFTVFSFFPDTPETTGAMTRLAKTVPGAFCVSRRLLTTSLAASIEHTLRLVTVLSLALVLGLTLLLSPNWRLALIALIPAGVAVLWALGVPALLHQTLNLCHVTAAAVVFGLCVDYGIYMTHGLTHGMERQSKTTIILTTTTSIVGAGVLLFTQHPVLFAIGLTLTTGMLVGHVLAIWAVPGLFALWGRPPAANQARVTKKAGLSTKSRAIPLLLFGVCALGRTVHAGTACAPLESRPFGDPTPARYSAVSSAVLQYRWFKFPALGVITVDTRSHHFALVGLSQLGINVFELSETNGRLQSHMPGSLLKRHPEIAAGAAADVCQMFFGLGLPPDARRLADTSESQAVFQQITPAGTLEYRLDPRSGLLLEKRLLVPRKYGFGSSVVWRIQYEDYIATGSKKYPRVIRFKQRHRHYAITLFLKEMRFKP